MNNLNFTILQVKSLIAKNNLNFVIAKPFRCLQLFYNETQNLNGLTKKISIYNNSNNHSFEIKSHFKNDYYGISKIIFNFKLTELIDRNLIFTEKEEQIFEGSCEEANEIFEALKKEFYDPHVKIPVPPKL
jgi:hypothetical protein